MTFRVRQNLELSENISAELKLDLEYFLSEEKREKELDLETFCPKSKVEKGVWA